MRIRSLAFAVAALAVPALLATGCATVHDPGWRGTGATPFDTAQADCRAEAAAAQDTARDARFEACMARHGWHRDGQ